PISTYIRLVISELSCPKKSPFSFSNFICQIGFTGNFTSTPLYFRNKEQGDELAIVGLDGSLHGENFGEGVHLKLKGTVDSSFITKGEKAGFSFEGELKNL